MIGTLTYEKECETSQNVINMEGGMMSNNVGLSDIEVDHIQDASKRKKDCSSNKKFMKKQAKSILKQLLVFFR